MSKVKLHAVVHCIVESAGNSLNVVVKKLFEFFVECACKNTVVNGFGAKSCELLGYTVNDLNLAKAVRICAPGSIFIYKDQDLNTRRWVGEHWYPKIWNMEMWVGMADQLLSNAT